MAVHLLRAPQPAVAEEVQVRVDLMSPYEHVEGELRRGMRKVDWAPGTGRDHLGEIRERTKKGCPLGLLLALILLPLLIVRALLATAAPKKERPARLCRTADECWQAGWDDGANDPPMTEQQIAKLAPLWRLYIRQPNDPAA